MKKSILALSLLFAASGVASAATITPVNVDPAGAGLNDTTARAPEGLNPGKTVGEQRRLVYQFASDIWGAILNSDVEVRVEASFAPLTCSAASGVLGSAGATQIFRDFDGAPLTGTWYHSALADAIAGVELDVDADVDIASRFNASLGGTNPDGTPCLTGSGWYYGLDGNTPAGAINFLDVVIHEIGHGLGFQGFDNVATGAFFSGFPNVYGANVYDNNSAMAWNAMSNPQRVTAAIGDALVWNGPKVTAQVPLALEQRLRLTTAGTISSPYAIAPAGYGPKATVGSFGGDIVLVNDGTAPTANACEPLAAGSLTGKVALIDRGVCSFKFKTRNAQNAGAVGVLVANNAAGFPGMGDDSSITTPITIPSLGITQGAGTQLKAALPGVTAGLEVVAGVFYGSDASGRASLFAPNPVQGGSSFSHYDTSLTPNAIQEPAISADLDANVRLDLSPALYADEGWVLNAGTATTRKGQCDTAVPVLTSSSKPGLVGGANLTAADAMCRRAGASKVGVRACMAPFLSNLRALNAIPASAEARVRICTL